METVALLNLIHDCVHPAHIDTFKGHSLELSLRPPSWLRAALIPTRPARTLQFTMPEHCYYVRKVLVALASQYALGRRYSLNGTSMVLPDNRYCCWSVLTQRSYFECFVSSSSPPKMSFRSLARWKSKVQLVRLLCSNLPALSSTLEQSKSGANISSSSYKNQILACTIEQLTCVTSVLG